MKKAEKQELITVLRGLANADGLITRKSVVDAARPTTSILHSRFEWRDKVAAEKYREQQAGEIIRVMVVVRSTGQIDPERVFVSLTPDRQEGGGGYRVAEEVVAEPVKYATMRHDAVQVLRGARRTYAKVRELRPIWKLVDGLGD